MAMSHSSVDSWSGASPHIKCESDDNQNDEVMPALELQSMASNKSTKYCDLASFPSGTDLHCTEDAYAGLQLQQPRQPRHMNLSPRTNPFPATLARHQPSLIVSTAEAIPSPPSIPQHLDAQQYLIMMTEATNRVKALAADQEFPSRFSATPLPQTLSIADSLIPSTEVYPVNIPGRHHHQQQTYRYSPSEISAAYRHFPHIGSLRRAQSFDAFSVQYASSPTPDSAISTIDSTPAEYQYNNASQNGYFSSLSAPSMGLNLQMNMSMAMDMNMTMDLMGHWDPVTMMESDHPYIPTPMPLATSYCTNSNKNSSRRRRPTSTSVPSSASSSPSPPSPAFHSSLSSSSSSLSLTLPDCQKCLDNLSSISSSSSPSISSISTTTPSINSTNIPAYNEPSLAITNNTVNITNNTHPPHRSKNAVTPNKPKARYVCQIPNCHRTFSRPFNLKSHGLTHETRRPHACPQCPKTFARIHDRDRHMKGHLLEKAHSCIVCLGRFARQDAVTRHLKLANEQNPCAMILKHRGVSFREAAAGRVQRSFLGEENVIQTTLETLEEQARKTRTRKNMELGMISMLYAVKESSPTTSTNTNANHVVDGSESACPMIGMDMQLNAELNQFGGLADVSMNRSVSAIDDDEYCI
ncbi:hypothetical protein BG011_007794 [Mortierella polycephala]|uniref:C2H2-type domain-containing protein n=1 Tax=Mortierella polycephala TaxID=41804 RepID=A0A9P6TYA7_9FUNG|nr:hypothetical protein BG011_007794 [Mortierella polycephala]